MDLKNRTYMLTVKPLMMFESTKFFGEEARIVFEPVYKPWGEATCILYGRPRQG